MADLGYVDFYEALSIYRYLDPATVQARREHASWRRRRRRRPSCRRCWPARSTRPASSARALGTLPSDADVERLHGDAGAAGQQGDGRRPRRPGRHRARQGGARARRRLPRPRPRVPVARRRRARRRGARVGGARAHLPRRLLADAAAQDAGRHARSKGGSIRSSSRSRWDDVLRALRAAPAGVPARARRRRPPTAPATSRTLADVARAAAALEQIAKNVATLATRE